MSNTAANGRTPNGQPDTRWVAWGRSLCLVIVIAGLAALGVANVATYSRWHEVEGGVFWGARAGGVPAIGVARGSPAATAGILPGDVLIAVNGAPIRAPADVVEYQHGSGG